jgi:hypothetical protein
MASRTYYRDPNRWKFTETDRKRSLDRYWRCPVRIVTDGMWADLWRVEGTIRGGGATTSVLSVLALHSTPDETDAAAGWTPWTYLSRRRVAALAGVHKDTATSAINRLVIAGLADTERRSRGQHEGGYMTFYRLAASLYPRRDEPYADIPAHLFYGGTWFLLPSPACRHLYVVLACLAKGRAAEPVSMKALARYSGLRRSTVVEAVQALTVPILGKKVDQSTGRKILDIALVVKGEAPPKKPTSYAPDPQAWRAFWPPDFLDTPDRVEAARRRFWPHLFNRGEV